MWYQTGTGILRRYNSSWNVWEIVESQTAADAYARAAKADDTADNKRRVFTAQPYPPYDIGDLWTDGPEG
jgi:phage-related protein